ncbi:sigma-70 family RNA polymerase sigma factor [Rhodococcus sp. IEGM 248]|uniref:RNA polymerase sigma factor n=1 Tax=Rhodococcus opacus TaxID=37919 RepID=UPI0013BFE5A5|nr:sigma-70 family RNA polymerase sigma factor [Rhodococcus opacus]MDV7090670.1 sigma-70 family RNA polymerase sigma factor [Rhodococcus opacus]NDV06543.1 sigma-70 family RNA polymerase sigma factor [Rhodococcus sp. IEGM 248]
MDGDTLSRVFREESGRALATVARMVGDLSLAEDAVQEAFAEAIRSWPEAGLPKNPGAWITTVARNRALDRLRRESLRGDKEHDAARLVPPPDEEEVWPVRDDQLRLMFTCCHPALSPESQVALTLRLVAGLRPAEIARLFLAPEPTVSQRLSRAKSKIRTAGIPFRVPPDHLLPERTPQVLACIYLVFTEGYSATSGDTAIRDELCEEALRLGRLLCELMPDEGEAWALTALMLFHDSRRAQRTDVVGDLVPLEEQDRRRWDRAKIEEGVVCLQAARRRGGGPYGAQATIAAAHATAPIWAATDWNAVVAGYDELGTYGDSPAVRLNRAVAVSFRDGPDAVLAELDALAGEPKLARTHTVHATRADLLRRAGRPAEASAEYRAAIGLAANEPTRRFLARRLAEVDSENGAR